MTEIKTLRNSKSEDDRRKCLELLEEFLKANPNDTEAWYDKAGCHDFLGEELAAEPCYRKAYELGWQSLPAEEQPSFFVGFGSTLRNNLKFEESIAVFKKGIEAFPNYPALKVFLAFSAFSNNQDRLAAETLFLAVNEVAGKGLDGYEKAVQWYADHLQTHPVKRDR